MDTIMLKESSFELSEEKKREWVAQSMELLEKYDYNPDSYWVGVIMDEWAKKKGWLVDLFRRSEFYNGNGQIIIPANLKRPVDENGIMQFKSWANAQFIGKMVREHEVMVGMFTYAEYQGMIDDVSYIANSLLNGAIYNGNTKGWYNTELSRMVNRRNQTKEKYPNGLRTVYCKGQSHVVSYETYKQIDDFDYLLNYALATNDDEPWITSERKAEYATKYCEKLGLKARPIVGQKVTKFIGKVLKETGLNKIVDIQTQTWVHNGQEFSREKDMGYNYWFALLGDSINPLEYTKEMVISVNPIDYWTMSFGYKWTSCHDIDKEDYRGVRENQHGGCYSGGTEAYMLDDSTIVVYIRPTEKELESVNELDLSMEEQSKFKRCLFYLGEDKLVQSRVYPDGRDGGDEGLAGQLRAIMQKVISELYDTPNMWTLKKGTSNCCEAVRTGGGIHYPDYENYSDCNVSYLRRIDGQLNFNCITVGAREIICPSCGSRHEDSNHITCYNCYEGKRCERCGDPVGSEPIYATNRYGDEVVFCCAECAYDAGYENTVDYGWRYDDGLYYDRYSEEYYVDGDDGIWIDDDWYSSRDNAEADGYVYCEVDDEWIYGNEDVRELADGRKFNINYHEDAVLIDDEWYLSIEDAEADGWIYDEEIEDYRRVA